MDAVAREFAGAYAQEQFKERRKSAALERIVESARQTLLAALPENVSGRKALEVIPSEYLLDEFESVIDLGMQPHDC